MRPARPCTFLVCLLVTGPAVAGDKQEVARDVGAVLAWRLGPEAFEQHCLGLDPSGADLRRKALDNWLAKNAVLIKAVDERVAQVIPLVRQSKAGQDMVQAVRTQVTALLREEFSSGRSAEESRAICQHESNATRPRWTSNGMPQVQNSLAALYDWQVAQERVAPGGTDN